MQSKGEKKLIKRGEEINKYDLARSFQDVAIDELVRKTKQALDEHREVKSVIVAGGVSANNYLREKMKELCEQENIDLCIPPMKYCTDNAAMIACAAYPKYLKGEFADLSLDAKSSLELY